MIEYFSWPAISRVFRSLSLRLMAALHPPIGYFLVLELSDGNNSLRGRLCGVRDCESSDSYWLAAASWFDGNLIFLYYYALVLISISFYVFVICCPSYLKDSTDERSLHEKFPETQNNIRFFQSKLPKTVREDGKTRSYTDILESVFDDRRFGVASLCSNFFFYLGIVVVALTSVFNVYITTLYILSIRT